jgi:hypothetical protein
LHPTFVERRGRHGGLVTRKLRLASIERNRLRPLTAINLNSGESLLSYHFKLHLEFGRGAKNLFDLSAFYGQYEYDPKRYYWGFLSFFIAHAVLYEDYHGGEDRNVLAPFTRDVFTPAFEGLTRKFGVSPLIVRMPWHPNLSYYPRPGEADWTRHEVIPEQLLKVP